MKYLLFFFLLLFISSTANCQNKESEDSSKIHNHNVIHHYRKKQKLWHPHPQITGLHNTGSSDGTMADSKSDGKVTTNPNGKNGPKNGLIKGKKK